MEGTTFAIMSETPQKNQSNVPYWKRKNSVKAPDNVASVGWVRPKVFFLCRENGGAPFVLESGKELKDVVIEYETYGSLNPEKSNAILITHALSGDAHVAGWDSTANADYRPWRLKGPGWWDNLVGPGQPFDTNRFFVICANVIGSCYGSTGPASPNPDDGNRPYGHSFPKVTVGDWVKTQVALIDYLGIRQLYAVVGGSLGGQQALEWAIAYPGRVGKCIMLASGGKLPTQGLGFNHVAKVTIHCDPKFNNGNIYAEETREPNTLIDLARQTDPSLPDLRYYAIRDRHLPSLHSSRMLAHITYLSASGMESKFGRKLQKVNAKSTEFVTDDESELELSVHGYLTHQGESFVERFDANSYLLIADAMDAYNVQQRWGDGDLVKAMSRIRAEMMVVSFSSDWLYPSTESHSIVTALLQNHHPVTSVDVTSNCGHDAFLVEEEKVTRIIRSFLMTPAPAKLRTQGVESCDCRKGGVK